MPSWIGPVAVVIVVIGVVVLLLTAAPNVRGLLRKVKERASEARVVDLEPYGFWATIRKRLGCRPPEGRS